MYNFGTTKETEDQQRGELLTASFSEQLYASFNSIATQGEETQDGEFVVVPVQAFGDSLASVVPLCFLSKPSPLWRCESDEQDAAGNDVP